MTSLKQFPAWVRSNGNPIVSATAPMTRSGIPAPLISSIVCGVCE